MILSRRRNRRLAMTALWRGSKIAEMELPAGDAVVTGSKTIQVEIKE